MKKNDIGIVSYGAYIPAYRIKVSDIAQVWRKESEMITHSLGVAEKAVPGVDEDAVTLAYEAASQAVSFYPGLRTDIGSIFVGSESHPYAVNPTSTIVAELLGIGHDYLASDTEFACKAATAGMQAIMGLVASGHNSLGLAIGADAAQSRPHDALEYTAGSGSAAFLIGDKDPVARIIDFTSYSSDTPDFWRRDGIRYPSHAGRFTGEPAYFHHVMMAAQSLFSKTKIKPEKVTWCVFHAPNGKFPSAVGKRLGFRPEQISHSLLVRDIGNPYSASSLLSLANVLDHAHPGELIFMVSYGSGAGSDAFLWETTPRLTQLVHKRKTKALTVKDFVDHKININYVSYLKQTHKI